MSEEELDARKAPPGRPRDAAKGDSILRATIDLLREGGYEALSIESVAQRAGVSRPTIYRRYQNKADLVVDVIGEIAGPDWSPLSMDIPDARSRLEADIQRLIMVLSASFDLMEQEGIAPGFLAELMANSDLANRFFTTYLDTAQQEVRRVFSQAAQRGEIREEPLPEVVLSLLVGGYVYHRFIIAQPFGPEERRIVAKLIASGLADR